MPKASFSSSGEKNTIAAQIRHLSLRLAILCLIPIIAIILSLYIIPFKEMFRYNIGSRLFVKNVLGNMLMFLPYFLVFILKT